ncbi:hypothetical protein [Persicitalea sp.]|uniref:hypothetical protein n=1 Tax=Persicitalea sp. TaxID=3100273 RepID=UPI0035940085
MPATVSEKSEPTRLNSIQISLLRLFDQNLNQSRTLEVRQLLMDYFDENLKAELDIVTAQRGYTEEDYRKMLTDDTYAIE